MSGYREVQQPLFCGWSTGPVSTAGLDAYLHLIRSKNDPDRQPRGSHNEDPNQRWRRLLDICSLQKWVDEISSLLADGIPRTFNRMMVEIADLTADIAFEKAPDYALWQLVADGRVEHTLQAPVLFRLRKEAN